MFLAIFIYLARSDCEDFSLPTESKKIIDAMRELKSGRSMTIFGINTFINFPASYNFSQFVDNIKPYFLGQFYTCLPIIIITTIVLIFFVLATALSHSFCLPFERTKPGFFTTIFWWIFFSLVFVVSIAYYIISIIHAFDFMNNFPQIPYIIRESVPNVSLEIQSYVNEYQRILWNSLGNNAKAYGAPSVIYSPNGVLKLNEYISQLNSLSQFLTNSTNTENQAFLLESFSESFSEFFDNESESMSLSESPSEDDSGGLSPYQSQSTLAPTPNVNNDCTYFIDIENSLLNSIQSFINNFSQTLDQVNQDLLQNISASNIFQVSSQTNNMLYRIFDPFQDFLSKAESQLVQYETYKLDDISTSFDTNTSLYTACFYALNIIGLILAIIYYIFQTLTFSMQNSFSRCCVVSIFPISIIVTALVGILGIVSTAVSCSIGDVCELSDLFASQYFMAKPDFIQNINYFYLTNNLFSMPNNSLYTAVNGSSAIPLRTIENSTRELLTSSVDLSYTDFNVEIPQNLIDFDPNSYMDSITSLNRIVANAYGQAIRNNCNSTVISYFQNFLNVVSEVKVQIEYGYNLQVNAIQSLNTANPEQAKAELTSNLPTILSNLESFSLSNEIDTYPFCCPLRRNKEIFCTQTGGTFSDFAIFAHFYLISLVAFGGLLCCRRTGMLSSDDDQSYVETQKRPAGKNVKSRKRREELSEMSVDDISQASRTRNFQNPLSESSDESSQTSNSGFDLYQQSKTGVMV